jgi:hypothetical protein
MMHFYQNSLQQFVIDIKDNFQFVSGWNFSFENFLHILYFISLLLLLSILIV